MPRFYYKARIKAGILVQGDIEAADPWLARKALAAQNLIVLELSRFNLVMLLKVWEKFKDRYFRKIPIEQKIVFINQVETGFSVGIPILQVLDFVYDQVENKHLKLAVKEIAKDVSQGSTLHQAFAKHPYIFDPLYTSLIRTGELSGQLEATLGRLAKILEQQAENRAKVKSATFYPKIVIFFLIVVLFVVVYFVIPKLKTFLVSMGTDLPPITLAVVGTSDFFVHYWYLVGAAYLALYSAFTAYVCSESGRLKFDQLKLDLPLLGSLFIHLELSNFCVLLDLLLASGTTLLDSFETLKPSQSNQVIRNEIDRFSAEIRRGGTLSAGLRSSKVLPPAFVGMVSIGEESGMLPKVLQKLGKHYQIQVDHKLNNLSKLIEPVMLSIIFVFVGILALAIFLPIWKMSSAVHMHK